MKLLSVRKFSSINEAALEILPVTLIIGPTSSGKSVLCKLAYFFGSLLTEQIRAITELAPHAEFTQQMKSKFVRWFPTETWGKQKFEISFEVGGQRIDINRTVSRGKAGKNVNIQFSSVLLEHYERSFARMQEKVSKKSDAYEPPEFNLLTWQIERSIRQDLQRCLGDDYISNQLFVPAGRSFFTSVGKAIAAFENSNMLDPLTVLFGRMYAAGDVYVGPDDANGRAIKSILAEATKGLLGGKLVKERDREVVHSDDGRTIPLSALSSGQQEIFPLLRTLPRSAPRDARRLVYVEEPEAHLFPNAQSNLIEALSTLLNLYGPTVEMVITTHSPYVLTKFNNLILAGKVGRRRNLTSAVASILPQRTWIAEGRVVAYALENGKLCPIIDKEGLIDGDYLDDVSDLIGNQFSRLLDLAFQSPTESSRRRLATK